MTTSQENIVMDSCQYTPVYLIQNPGAIQGRSYVLTQSAVEEQKPVSDNLKRFYENSGILENNVVNNVINVNKPRILKKHDNKVGNNLKLASFLMPKNVQTNKQYVPISNIMLKPVTTPTTVTAVMNTVPRVEVERKIVKMKNFPNVLKQERILPKIKPKENTPSPTPTKHTSVQLLKLGETYHSLNQLSDEQMKMVNQALKIFSGPEKIPMEPTYDPVTNTRFIYKVVSPRDLTVVGKNKILIKNKKEEIKRESKKLHKVHIEPEKEPQPLPVLESEGEEPEAPVKTKVTRSGRKVKFPKQIVPEGATQKPRKKTGTIVSCFQCSTEFCSLYRLQKHYENHPTHIPAKIHSNLFHCLLAIIKSGSEEDQANIFIQQLEQLLEKIKSLLPCLLKKIDACDGKSCSINDDIGKLFGMNPGKYNLNMDALTCVKDKDGFCRHNPPPRTNQFNVDLSKPSQLWLSKHNEEIANTDNGTDDCARINAVDKWPTASKRIWKLKQQKSQDLKAKRIRIASESDTVIELGMEDLISFAPNEQSAIPVPPKSVNILDNSNISNIKDTNMNEDVVTNEISTTPSEQMKKDKGPPHTQFHSAHFDIRSSPIKPSAAVFNKFQIDPEKISQYSRDQIIRPLDLDKEQNEVSPPQEIGVQSNADDNCDFQELLSDNSFIELTCKEPVVTHDINFHTAKDWVMNSSVDKTDNYMKTDNIMEPSLLHDDHLNKLPLNNVDQNDHMTNDNRLQSDQSQSVLNFLESLGNECLEYPETDIRNNTVDFQLDLFAFHNS